MAGRFLKAAYRVLDQEGKPLSANQIVEIAMDKGYLVTKGKTPNHTMRARLSDEIRQAGASSIFQRTGSNRFGLREWNLGEFHARPFTKSIPSEVTVCVPGTVQDLFGEGVLGYKQISPELMEFLSDRRYLIYVDRKTAETTSKYKQLIAYVWLETSDGLILAYTRGKYSSAHPTLLLGRRSVGFGGHVLRQDADNLFSIADGGLEQAAMREIGEELRGMLPDSIEPTGVIWDDSSYEGQKHIGIVMKGILPSSTTLSLNKGELSINQLEFLTKSQLWNAYHTMEFWSQLLIRQFAADERPDNISVIAPSIRPRNLRKLVLVGEIAAGKSSVAAGIAKNPEVATVSASEILRRIMGVGPVSERDRSQFQDTALEFIRTDSGPAVLASEIAKEANRHDTKLVLIDGIRQLSTLRHLRSALDDLVVLFVDCPRDLAFRNYQVRRPDATVLDFAAVREHEVEAELPRFRYEADAILNNADSLNDSILAARNWLIKV